MPIATTPMLERVARALAGLQLADTDDGAASLAVDRNWPDHIPAALAILKAMREPDEEMARAGNVDIWGEMIAVAIRAAQPNPTSFP